MRVNPAASFSSTHSENSSSAVAMRQSKYCASARPLSACARHSGESSRNAASSAAECSFRHEFKLAADKVQIATQVVNLGERPVGGGGARRRLGFRQRSEGVVELGQQPVGRGGADQRAHPVSFRAAIGKRAAIGFERLPPAAGVKLDIADLQGEVDAGLGSVAMASPRRASAIAWSCRKSAS